VFGLAWVRTRKEMLAAMVVSLLCLGTLTALYVKVSADLTKAIAAETGGKGGEDSPNKMMKKDDVSSGGRMGLWATCLALIGIAVITGMGLKEKPGELPGPEPVPPPTA
jgi:hypothetical protein